MFVDLAVERDRLPDVAGIDGLGTIDSLRDLVRGDERGCHLGVHALVVDGARRFGRIARLGHHPRDEAVDLWQGLDG